MIKESTWNKISLSRSKMVCKSLTCVQTYDKNHTENILIKKNKKKEQEM